LAKFNCYLVAYIASNFGEVERVCNLCSRNFPSDLNKIIIFAVLIVFL